MKKEISLSELRKIVQDVIKEEGPPPLPPRATRSAPPPLPSSVPQGAPRAAPPAGGPSNFKKFQADARMAIDAANRVRENMESANTKEALRWLDKVISFAQSAKASLGVK